MSLNNLSVQKKIKILAFLFKWDAHSAKDKSQSRK
jgi:hypothetical protein